MPIYKCEKCLYQTTVKSNFDSHLSRKLPCNPKKPNKNRKDNVEFACKICNKVFARSDCLNRHNTTFHVAGINNLDGNNNQVEGIQTNNKINNLDGNNNLVGGTNNQTNINNPIINITVPIIYNYSHNDINDLSLFEQYQSLTTKSSPYVALLDHLNLNPNKPKYKNIRLGSVHRNTMDVHNGEEWMKEIVNTALCQIIDTKRMMIGIIFNRFRCFLSNKAIKLIPDAFYYGFRENYSFHKQIMLHLKVHLYNKRNNKDPPNTTVPDDRKNEVWWALSKRFNWKEVTKLIIKMDKLQINFDKDLNEIKVQILDCIRDKPKRKQFFHKLLKKIDVYINNFEANNDLSESSQDENES